MNIEKNINVILGIFLGIILAVVIWNLVFIHKLTDDATSLIEAEHQSLSPDKGDAILESTSVATEALISVE